MKSTSAASAREAWLAAGLVILATLIAYGPMIPRLGFYRDDWYLLWTASSQGPQGLLDLFRGDRPFVGWLYRLDFAMLGTSAIGWHVYALAIKAASGLACLWLLRTTWPDRRLETTAAALLFVVYPGFYQQANALTFKQLLFAYAAALFSLTFTLRAVQAARPAARAGWTALAVGSGAVYLLIYEALIGMEAARLGFMVLLLGRSARDWKEALRRTIWQAVPYLVFSAGFVTWRIFFFDSTRRATDIGTIAGGYASLHGWVRIFFELLKDLLETSILAWAVPFYQFSVGAIYKDLGLALGLALLAVLAGAVYGILARREGADRDSPAGFPFEWTILGLGIILVTTLPVILAGRNVLFGIQWDRYTYQSALGVALFMTGLVFHAVRGHVRWVFLALLVMSGVSVQVFSGMFYRDFWTVQREAWWQLAWRAPQINDGTTLVASLPGGFQFAEEYEVWGPLNMVYRPARDLAIPAQVMMDRLVVDLERGTVEERIVRGTITVARDYNHSLVVAVPSTASCLRVYDGALPLVSLSDPLNARLAAAYSDLDRIDVDPPAPVSPGWVLGPEPEHGWCYFYQKMNLALQAGRWSEAAGLAEEARERDVQPSNPVEWLTPLQAYANAGDEKRAKQVSSYITDRTTRLDLCQQLGRIAEWPEGYRSDLILKYLCKAD